MTTYIPIGPSPIDLWRVQDLLESLRSYEPSLREIVLSDHSSEPRNFAGLVAAFPSFRFTVLPFSKQCDNGSWLGSACVANLLALRTAWSINPDAPVLKLDCDALVIGPFMEAVQNELNQYPEAGILGTASSSSNPENRSDDADEACLMLLRYFQKTSAAILNGTELDNRDIVRLNLFTSTQKESFVLVAGQLTTLLAKAYRGRHCQGGAYIVTPAFLLRYRHQNSAIAPERFQWIPLAEDKFMGMMCNLLDLEVMDIGGDGRLFGVQSHGLPYSKEELVARRFSLIHSVRTSPEPEYVVRKFFRTLRLQA